MARIKTKKDIPFVIEELRSRAIIPSEEIDALEAKIEQIAHHSELKKLFEDSSEVKNESSIITKAGKLLIPDRINFDGKNVHILDYKTGAEYATHGGQINEYASALEEMGYDVKEKIIVYTSEVEISINKV
jgi:CRISPR/Cas system-associated exonuclease Cas4 (RecB family)